MADGDRRRAPIAIEVDVAPSRIGKSSVAVDAAREHDLIEMIERERRDRSGRHHERRAIDEAHAALGARARYTQQHDAERHVDRCSRNEEHLETDERQEHEPREHHADDRAERVRRIHDADRAFPIAPAHQHPRDERERHPCAKCRRKHHDETRDVARDSEEVVAPIRDLERADERRGPTEAGEIEGNRRECCEPHCALHDAERAHGIGKAIGARAYPARAEGKPEDECREHQLEGVRRAPEQQRQHPNPRDLVNERGDGGTEGDDEQQAREAVGHSLGRCRRIANRLGLRRFLRSRYARAEARGAERDDEDDEVDRGRGDERERESAGSEEPEACEQHADCAAEAIGEVQLGENLPRVTRHDAQHAGAHEREGGAEKNGLREDEERGDGPLHDDHDVRRPGE